MFTRKLEAIKHKRACFIRISNPEKKVEKMMCSIFRTNFDVVDIQAKHS